MPVFVNVTAEHPDKLVRPAVLGLGGPEVVASPAGVFQHDNMSCFWLYLDVQAHRAEVAGLETALFVCEQMFGKNAVECMDIEGQLMRERTELADASHVYNTNGC